MSKKLQLTIPKPCHENWDNMTPVQQGKFCGSCQKQVVDFSDMSDRQVAEFFKKPSTGSICGRFMTDQLDRSIEIPKKRIPWLKYFFQFALPAFLVSIKASAQKTQGTVAITKTVKDTTKIPKYPVLMGKIARPVCTTPMMGDVAFIPEKITKLSGTIQLKVVNENGEPIPYASIETGVIGKGGAADKNGLFNLDKSILNINGNIFVSSVGYERKEVHVKTISGLAGTFTIELQIKGWMKEVVVTAFGQRSGCMTLGGVQRVEASQLKNKNVINGKVIDEKGNPVFYASVVIKGTRNGVSTNENGSFSLQPVAGWNNIALVGSFIDYESTEVIVDKKNLSDSVIIQLRPRQREMLVGELVVCRKPVTKKEVKNIPLLPAIPGDKQPGSFKVFPNPVLSGSDLNIELKQTEEGYYSLQLLNQSGQQVHQQEIWIDAEARLLNIDVPHVAAGTYFLALTNKKSGMKFTEKIIIL
jgi:hypothetical protein